MLQASFSRRIAILRLLGLATTAAGLTAAGLTAAGLTAGCSLVGAGIHKLSGPPSHPPAVTLAPVPTLVLVDREGNFGDVATDAHQIAQEVTDQIQGWIATNKAYTDKPKPTFIDPAQVMNYRQRRKPDGQKMRPSEIAAACGAKQFIYLQLTTYRADAAGPLQASDGRAEARLYVIDSDNAKVLWPAEEDRGYPIAASVPFTPSPDNSASATVRSKLNADLIVAVSRIFVGWTED